MDFELPRSNLRPTRDSGFESQRGIWRMDVKGRSLVGEQFMVRIANVVDTDWPIDRKVSDELPKLNALSLYFLHQGGAGRAFSKILLREKKC